MQVLADVTEEVLFELGLQGQLSRWRGVARLTEGAGMHR